MGRNILILGAGKSSIALIDYLVQHAAQQQWEITVADLTAELALQKTGNRPHTHATEIDLNNVTERQKLIATADVVISMLPPAFHLTIAKDCLALKKHLVTPSYITDDMRALNAEVEKAGLVFMNEIGLDPGIDHMSAMQLMDGLVAKGYSITGFKSHCGGLIAPENDDNPWHYKFTWNPRNVVLAGQGDGGIHYMHRGHKIELSYQELFAHVTELEVDGTVYESYPNRDSLKYINLYELYNVETMYRGTLRVSPFCKGWNCLVKLGLTQDKDVPVSSLLVGQVEERSSLGISPGSHEFEMLQYLEISERLQALKGNMVNPAKWLQAILEEKWKLKPGDKDLVVMVHQVEYLAGTVSNKIQSTLVFTGKDEKHTAMAITVGLPVAMVTKMILNGGLERCGVLMPKYAEIYNPILAELKEHGIIFNERELTD